MKRGASNDDGSAKERPVLVKLGHVRTIRPTTSSGGNLDDNISSQMGSRSNNIVDLTDDMDLTEERMRKMNPEQLNDELIRRGVDSHGLRKIWTERPMVPSGNASFSSMAAAVSNKDNSIIPPSNQENNRAGHLQLSPNKTYVLRFDGGSKGNPGISGAGMVLYEKYNFTNELWCGSLFLTINGTNNEAEYKALINGLKCAKLFGVKHILAEGDSDLVVRQMLGSFKCKSPNLIPLLQEAMSVKKNFLSFQIRHIPRAQNFRADELANEAMFSRGSRGVDVLFEENKKI
jgi:ribonuclease HI